MDPIQIAALRDHLDSALESPLNRPLSGPSPQERIVKAAERLFWRCGLRSVTLEQIAGHAETNTAFVIQCFGSLDGLIVDFLKCRIEASTSAYAELWTALEHKYGRAADEQLRDWVRVVAPNPTAPIRLLPFSAEAIELADKPNHKGLALIRQHKSALRIKLAQLCCDAFYRDPEILADKLLMLVEGARVHAAPFGGEEASKRLIEATEDLFKRHWQPQ